MPTLGKKFWGSGGKSFDAVEALEGILENKAKKFAKEVTSDFNRRSYTRELDVEGTKVKFSYCSSWPGFGTVRWEGRNKTIESAVGAVAEQFGRKYSPTKELK